jgi:hypothetical protein
MRPLARDTTGLLHPTAIRADQLGTVPLARDHDCLAVDSKRSVDAETPERRDWHSTRPDLDNALDAPKPETESLRPEDDSPVCERDGSTPAKCRERRYQDLLAWLEVRSHPLRHTHLIPGQLSLKTGRDFIHARVG